MTQPDRHTASAEPNPLSLGADYDGLAARFRPVFARIAEGTLERERTRSLPYEPVEWLKQAGFGAVRVPREYGGAGASLPQLIQLLIELGEADSNLPQALRGHFAFVEDRLNAAPGPARDVWFQRFVAGELVGNAWTEVGNVAIGDVITRVSRDGERWVVDGEKYYTTGSIFADWIDVYARRDEDGKDVIAAVRTDQPGVRRSDDWDGVGRAALRDVTQEVRARRRIFSHGNASSVARDSQVQQVVGQVAARVFAAESTAVRAAEAAQRAYEARFGESREAEREANVAAELDSARGQIVIADLVLQATTQLFNALSASATSETKRLDRHWRNARTAASHNPIIYKERIVGDWEVSGTEPPYVWQIGSGPVATAAAE